MDALEKRRLRVLQLFHEYQIALPKRTVFVNLKREYNYAFTEETLGTRVDDLTEAGYLDFLDIGNGYYIINESGIKYFEKNSDALDPGSDF